MSHEVVVRTRQSRGSGDATQTHEGHPLDVPPQTGAADEPGVE